MNDLQIIENMYDRKLLESNETVVMAEGLEDALIGITASIPKRAIYDYWKCIGVLINLEDHNQSESSSFNCALEWLEDYVNATTRKEFVSHAPIFIKTI